MFFFRKYNKKSKYPMHHNNPVDQGEVSTELDKNVEKILSLFSDMPDLTIRHLVIKQTQTRAALVYLSGITASQMVYNHVLHPLLFEGSENDREDHIQVSIGEKKEANTWFQVEDAILNGNCVLFVEKESVAFIFETPEFPKRSIEDSPIESSIFGTHVGFTETGSDNVALMRKCIRNRELKVKEMTVGERGNLKLSILYLSDVVNVEVLNELEKRLNNIHVDNVMGAGALAEYIQDNSFSPFPQLLLTEKPDFAVMEILEGRMVIVVDNSPNVIIGPTTFGSFLRTVDDYGTSWIVASFIRLIRYVGFFIAIFLPATYIATISFHYEVIPLKLLLSIGGSREQVPLPPFIEALVMELTLEMLREAGVRLPAKIGQTVGIVGGIVIGQAAVEAGLVSNIMVIVVALTAIASFIIPNYEMGSAIRIIRFLVMILASLFGFVGISVGFMILIAHLISLESLSMPYSSPIAPLRFSDWKDLFIRFPQWSIDKRPFSTRPTQLKKANSNFPKGEN